MGQHSFEKGEKANPLGRGRPVPTSERFLLPDALDAASSGVTADCGAELDSLANEVREMHAILEFSRRIDPKDALLLRRVEVDSQSYSELASELNCTPRDIALRVFRLRKGRNQFVKRFVSEVSRADQEN